MTALDLSADLSLLRDPAARQERALQIFRSAGAFLEGHFTYTSGRHGNRYLEKFRIFERAEHTEPLCRMIAANFSGSGADLVAGPTTGGIIMAYEVGRLLGLPGIFCEKEDGRRTFRRGFTITPGQRVLVVDDIVTTGGSLLETFAAVEALGGIVAGVGVLADRSGGRVSIPHPYLACLQVEFDTWAPEECPLCAAGDAPQSHRGAQTQ